MLRILRIIRKILLPILHGFLSSFRTRAGLQLKVIALRHQLEVAYAASGVGWTAATTVAKSLA
jgi:hypothetical protein